MTLPVRFTPTDITTDTRSVAHALALLWQNSTPTTILHMLRTLAFKKENGHFFSENDVKDALGHLQNLDGVEISTSIRNNTSLFLLAQPLRSTMYEEALARYPSERLVDALLQVHNSRIQNLQFFYWPLYSEAGSAALFRLLLYTGADEKLLLHCYESIASRFNWHTLFHEAYYSECFIPELFLRITPQWRWQILNVSATNVYIKWNSDEQVMLDWACKQYTPQEMPESLRHKLATLELFRGNINPMHAMLNQDNSAMAKALRACALIQKGQWASGQTAFAEAIKQRQSETGEKKNLLPESITWMYALALLAQGSPQHIELAQKFFTSESRSRKPSPLTTYGLWAHAASVRLGDEALNKEALLLVQRGESISFFSLWRLLLCAWLASEHPLSEARSARQAHDSAVLQMRHKLQDCGLTWLVQQVDAAVAILTGNAAPSVFFASTGGEKWRNVLDSLRALSDSRSPQNTSYLGQKKSQILWQITLGHQGNVQDITPLEQKLGVRGWSKPRPVALTKLTAMTDLDAHDNKVLRALRHTSGYSKGVWLDRAAAIMALIGHPAVILSSQPDALVDLVEDKPQLETLRETTPEGERFVLRINPAPHPETNAEENLFLFNEQQRRAHEALRSIHVLQDSSQRVRVIQLTPAQRRAAQLVSARLDIPVSAQNELQDALRILAGHFNVHSDDAATAVRQVPASSRLRAELSPAGDGLLLRLVVAPLGAEGPRVMPGAGRKRLIVTLAAESIGTERDLAAERNYLEAVLARLDFLDAPAANDTLCEWTVGDAELALAMVETLPQLPAIEAIDWPRGKPLRVSTVDVRQLKMTVKSERNWLQITGNAVIDEGRVFELQTLLAAAHHNSRFVALGEGAYLALSKALRDKLNALAVVLEASKDGLRAPTMAAVWLDETLEDVPAEFDTQFAERIARLRQVQNTAPQLPPGLQATLRTYQEDGFVWAMRLAAAGFGACLADDMGLGKTLQALAVLLARAENGPALVVAPTSVCGNWLSETLRFAPGLNVQIYGEGERDGIIENLGANDVLIVSYTLMQQAGEAFAARTWHTLVADEAQAVKNSAAKRSQALFDLPADFRMALSGTPVENRLSELWSIMRFCNPGLLSTLTRFNERFVAPIERERNREAQRLLRRLISPFVLRRTKTEVLDDLPPRTELVLNVVPDADEAAHYEALRRNLVSEAESFARTETGKAGQARLHILAQLMKLRRAACDPRLTTPNLGYIGAKVRAFTELAAELVANGHKALVFSQFVDFLTLLRAPLDEAGIAYQYLDGSTPPPERTRRVAAFQAGVGSLFLISLKAGGFGLNLTAADYVVIADPWWNPAAEDQAMGRAHRIGQQRPVTVYRLVSQGTLEERIIELHHEKRTLAESVLSGGEEGIATLPSTEELIALLRG